jgi:hypothetical protein
MLAALLLLTLLGAGSVIAFVTYRQLDSDTVRLEGAVKLASNGQGALCGDASVVVAARSLAQWELPVEDGQNIAGTITVEGDETADIGFSIWSPTNRVVAFVPGRTHQHEFSLPSTIRGAYRFDFDNRHSTFTDKKVTVSICVT